MRRSSATSSSFEGDVLNTSEAVPPTTLATLLSLSSDSGSNSGGDDLSVASGASFVRELQAEMREVDTSLRGKPPCVGVCEV